MTRENIPGDWDRLKEPVLGASEGQPEPPPPVLSGSPTVLLLVGSAWGDIVSILAVCTGALLALVALGYRVPVLSLVWAAALGALWWIVAAAILLVVRRGTPGMLMAGVLFASRIARRRIPVVVVTAMLTWLALGLPALLGARRSPLRLAAGTELSSR